MLWSVALDPEMPAELHGTKALFAIGVFADDPADASPVLDPFARLGEPMIDLSVVECDAERPTPQSLIAIRTLGGAIDRVSPEESAFPHRGARFNLSIDASWTDPSDADRVIGRVRASWEATRPFANGGVYLNFAV
jgi:hypothetical protein